MHDGPTEYRVASLAALENGEPILADVAGQEIALFICRGRVVASQGQCPHNGGPLHEGEVEGTILTCPWHGWTFDLETGECAEDEDLRLQRFPVRIVGDDILVAL